MFLLMYSTAYRWTHVWWSETRFWMALYMGAAMAVIMLGFMLKMYENKKANVAIFGGGCPCPRRCPLLRAQPDDD